MLLMLASRVLLMLLMLAPGVLLLQGHLQFLDSIDMWSLVGAAQFSRSDLHWIVLHTVETSSPFHRSASVRMNIYTVLYLRMSVCMYVCLDAYMYVYIYVCLHARMSERISACAYAYVRLYVHLGVCSFVCLRYVC